MRSTALLALLVAPTLAWAAPTAEELALRAALDGRTADVVRLLERAPEPRSRWAAARHALLLRDFAAATRLLSGAELRDVWGRIDLAAARGELTNAAALALVQMDAAVAGAHRDALAELLIGWAKERATTDPGGAARFLLAATGLAPAASLRHAAEDALFRLPAEFSSGAPEGAARVRLTSEPANVPARLRVAAQLSRSRPTVAAAWLAALAETADREDAAAAAEQLVALDVPTPIVLDALATLGRRFPTDTALARLRLTHAESLVPHEEALAVVTLTALEGCDPVAQEAREAHAAAVSDPGARRALWLAIAEREGASARGDAARSAALDALVEAVRGVPAGPPRVEAARKALATPDGAGTPELLHLAIPDDAARTPALWALATRFPDGAWCDELGDRLLAAGASRADAERYTSACTSPASVGGSLLFGQVTGDARLHLLPRAGGLEVSASATAVLRVSQHRVDPEALFRATSGHPLDAALDAFLLEPDLTWEVAQPDELLRTHDIVPRSGGPLTAITVRAEDQRGTALVVADPLEVSIVRRGSDVALGVLRGESPVAGAELLVLDDDGAPHRARTAADGIALLHDLPGAIRVMARRGGALGFATAGASGSTIPSADTWSVVVWDRAVPVEGAVVDVTVLGSRAGGDARGQVRVQSRDASRGVLEEVPVTLVDGAARARLFVMGRGTVAIMDGEKELSLTTVKAPVTTPPPARIVWSPAAPKPGETVVATILPAEPIGPGGLAGTVTVATEWSSTTTDLVLGSEGALFPVELAPDDGASVSVRFTLADGRVVSGGVRGGAASSPEGRGTNRAALAGPVPAVVAPGAPFRVGVPSTSWLRATGDDGRVVWARADESIALPNAGTWQLCAWDDACGPTTPVVVDARAAAPWTGPSVLAAVTAEGIRSARFLRAGDTLAATGAGGTRSAWLRTADDTLPAVPVRGGEAPEITVDGALSRGGSSTLTLAPDLPAGTKVWAWLRDGASTRLPRAATVAAPWDGPAGTTGDAWSAEARWGEAIAAALLGEEERIAEATDIERVDFGFSAGQEVGELGSIGASGYGSGGGGYGSHSSSVGGGIILGALDRAPLPGDPHVIGVVEGVAPGAARFEVPAWIAAADLEVVVRTPDGRWASRMLRLDVGGGPLLVPPAPVDAPPPLNWDGAPASLLPLARALPADAREHALSALVKAGVSEAEAPRRAAWSLDQPPSGPSTVLGRHLRGAPGGATGPNLTGLPDVRRADRAEAALRLAPTDPDRARAAAARLLGTAELEPWARARAGLALWVAGSAEDARAALTGDDPGVAAARAVVTGTADARFAPAWWATARAEGANASDRALAIHALTLLPPGRPVAPLAPVRAAAGLSARVEPAWAEWRGEVFPRGEFVPAGDERPLPSIDAVPAGRLVPLVLSLPPAAVPTRLACPAGDGVSATVAWLDLPPATEPRAATCAVRLARPGPVALVATWYAPDGGVLADTTLALTATAARDSTPTDPMSARERLGLGLRLATAGDPDGIAILERLLAEEPLPGDALERASAAVLAARRDGEPAALIGAFQRYREQAPGGALDVGTAAALAHAYARAGSPARALAAARVVLDARFKEELGAVSSLQAAGLDLTSLKLLRALLDRYPEGPTVVTARYLAPSVLLQRAEGDGDRLGYTRSSLRHTAAAELATFLLLHPDAEQAPEAAALLVDVLHALGDPARERALAGPLARRYREAPAAWRLALADARATLAAGQPAAAARVLDALTPPPEGEPDVALEQGRAYEALGRLDDARAAYDRSGTAEARERRAWLDRDDLPLPPLLLLRPGSPPRVPANLQPGAEVTITAIRIQLEAALLRDGGRLDPGALNVAGLTPAASRTASVGADGDVPLPVLPDGAYVVTVATGSNVGRMVVVRSDAELLVESRDGVGTLVHLSDVYGEPLPGAQLWIFAADEVQAARTDGGGAAWLSYGSGTLPVLARVGDRYALANLDRDEVAAPARPSPDAGYDDVLRKNGDAYNQLFQQEQRQMIEANAL